MQVLANRPDIIREDYMNELCVLQDDVPAFPNEVLFLFAIFSAGLHRVLLWSHRTSQALLKSSLQLGSFDILFRE